jgi:hypothetical protein
MKKWLAVLGVLLAGALLLPQHAWSQGAIVNNGLQLQGTPLNIWFVQGSNTGTLTPASLSGNQTWTLPDASGTILLSSTIGTTAWLLGGNTLTSVQNLGTVSSHDLPIITNNVERMRITAAGDVVVQNQAPTGATKVIIRAGANQAGVNLLEWQNNSGAPLGFIRHEGSVMLVYDPPTARQAFFGVAKPSGALLIGIGPDVASGGWGVGVYDDLTGQLRAGMGKVGTQWRMGVGNEGAQNGVLLSWATTTTDDEPRIVVANGSLANPVFLVDREGDVTVRGTTVALPNIPSGSATEVLVWNAGNVQRRAAEGLAWMLTGNSITSAWNGTSGNFLGTTNAQPLVIATTYDSAADPVLDQQHRADACDGDGECGHWDGGADGAVAGERWEHSDHEHGRHGTGAAAV